MQDAYLRRPISRARALLGVSRCSDSEPARSVAFEVAVWHTLSQSRCPSPQNPRVPRGIPIARCLNGALRRCSSKVAAEDSVNLRREPFTHCMRRTSNDGARGRLRPEAFKRRTEQQAPVRFPRRVDFRTPAASRRAEATPKVVAFPGPADRAPRAARRRWADHRGAAAPFRRVVLARSGISSAATINAFTSKMIRTTAGNAATSVRDYSLMSLVQSR